MTKTPPPSAATYLGDIAASPPSTRPRGWAWWICGLLMLATVVNYMDRQALSVTAWRIKSELKLTREDYG
jgi:ACS family hexuronate transporter-like MFS transporter